MIPRLRAATLVAKPNHYFSYAELTAAGAMTSGEGTLWADGYNASAASGVAKRPPAMAAMNRLAPSPAPAWSSTAPVTRATKKTAQRIDRMPEDSLHEIDGIATKQGDKRLPDCLWQGRRTGRRRV